MIRLLSTWAWTNNSIYHITFRVTFDLRKGKGRLSLNISYLTGAAELIAAKAFLVGTSGPKGQGRILAEYHWWIQYIRPFGLGTTLSFHLSTSLDLHCHLFRHPMGHLLDASKQSQRRSGHPFKINESANIHNNHKLLDLTLWHNRIHHKHIFLFLLLVHPCPSSSFSPYNHTPHD